MKKSADDELSELNESRTTQRRLITFGYGLKWWDIWALGITIVIGGQYFSWNSGLASGFGSFMVSTILMGFAYICLCLSLSELSSALPFAGGAYGLARCTLGFYPGFLIGASETIQYIFYTSASVIFLTEMISQLNNSIIGYEPLVWLMFYSLACVIYIYGGSLFWRFNIFLAVLSLCILLFYCFGSMAFVDMSKYGQYIETSNGWFVGGVSSFMHTFPLAAWFYVGVESLNMTCDDIDEPRLNVPKGQVSSIVTLFVTSILTLIVTSSLPPGIAKTASTIYPLNTGFSLIFNTSSDLVLLLSMPATFATAFGFIYSYSKLISAMALSKLWPEILGCQYSKTGASYGSILFGSLLSYLMCLVSYYNENFASQLFNVCILAAFVAYLSQCVGYISLQTCYSNLTREFRSPFGIAGAVFSLFVWMLGIICVVFFQDNYLAVSIYAGIVGVLSVYYFVYAGKIQTFNEQERSILFAAHVVNNSIMRRKSRRFQFKRILRKLRCCGIKIKVINTRASSKFDSSNSKSGIKSGKCDKPSPKIQSNGPLLDLEIGVNTQENSLSYNRCPDANLVHTLPSARQVSVTPGNSKVVPLNYGEIVMWTPDKRV